MAAREVLSDDVIPFHYALSLTPNFSTFKYEGNVEIDVDVQVATKTIEVNAKDLSIHSASFSFKKTGDLSATIIDCESFSVVKAKKRVVFTFAEVLPTGNNGTLSISFQGVHNDEMAGFYRSSYLAKDGTRKYMVTTQLEAIDARRAFPCWDEPAHKATFHVTLIVEQHYLALSNMGEKSVEALGNGLKKVQFATTPKMSTYLLAFIVGEFDYISETTKDGVIVRCLAVPGKADQCAFAQKCAVKCLEFYNDFFAIPYPLRKVDMIAIPDFSAGAMENWGLVTYREIDLLCNEDTASISQKMRVCSVVAHELAHQWFGNLVTMQWWNDLWLNEGFASFMQELASDHLFPEWKVWEGYIEMTQGRALSLDALRGSHPIQVDIPRAEDVEEVFDAICYHKGSSVIRLVYRTLGHDKFQKGLQNYMQKYKYENTVTSDLWREWEQVSDLEIEKMMKTWTEQMGFPLLTVHKEGSELKISQQWYIGDGSKKEGDEKVQWVVPVVVGDGQAESQLHFMKEQQVRVPAPSGSWIKVNFGQHVPLRVLYSEEMLNALIKGIPQLDPVDCIGLLSDSFSLFKSHHLDGMKVLQILCKFAKNDNTNIWNMVSSILASFEKILLGLPHLFEFFKQFGAKIVAAQSEKLGWNHRAEDSDLTKQLRGILVTLQAKFCQHVPEVLDNAERRYKLFLEDNETKELPSDYRRAAFILVLSRPETMKKRFQELIDIAVKESTEQSTRVAIYQALGTVPSLELKEEVLNWSLTDDVRKQDFFYTFIGVVSSSKEGNDLGFAFFSKRWLDLKAKAGGGIMQAVVRLLCSGTDNKRADDVDAFFKDKQHEDLKRTIEQTNEATRATAKVIDAVSQSDLAQDKEWKKLLLGLENS